MLLFLNRCNRDSPGPREMKDDVKFVDIYHCSYVITHLSLIVNARQLMIISSRATRTHRFNFLYNTEALYINIYAAKSRCYTM